MVEDIRQRSVVLVVDDTPESLSFLTETIERAGMTVLIATDGGAALDLLEHITPDLILMDAVMPGMDGFEATRRVKRDVRFAHLPVIFMTGLTEPEHVVEGLNAGAVDYVRKPIILEELLARVRVHLANARVTHGSHYALDAAGRYLLAVDEAGTVIWCTPGMEAVLARLAPGWETEGRILPALLALPVRRLISAGEGGTPQRLEQDGSRLELVLLRRLRGDEYLVRLSETREPEELRLLQERHGLTAREAEVLLWISRGKANREISEILGISPRTVNKHLEQVFEKLGVENRASAAASAVATLTQ
jgi:DNA-binding NarL/FixJ family response regulator